MKIGLSSLTVTSAVAPALGASAAQVRVEVAKGQATTAQTQAAKKVAMWYQAEADLFNALEHQIQHQTMRRPGP
jgi:hypothetical protein